jgi:hypothetical protein
MKIKVRAYHSGWSGRWYWSVLVPDKGIVVPALLVNIFPQGRVLTYVDSESAFSYVRRLLAPPKGMPNA